MTRYKKYLIFLVLFLIVILSIHVSAMSFFLYWKFRWLDIVLHFLGGAWVASLMGGFILYSKGNYFKLLKPGFFLVIMLGFTALIGVFWEFFEFLFDKFIVEKTNMDFTQLGVIDTMADLFFDLLGGLIVSLLLIKKIKYDRN